MVKKVLLATVIMAFASTPAWALPAGAPSNEGTARAPETTPVGPPSSTPDYSSNPGTANRSEEGSADAGGGEHRSSATGEPAEGSSKASENGGEHRSSHEGTGSEHKSGEHGKSHKCMPHGVAYVVKGTLVSAKLEAEEGSRNAYKGEITINVKRTNHHARAAAGMEETYMVEGVHVHGPISVESLKEGDWVKLIGKVTTLAKRCEAGEFEPTITIHRLIVHAPRTSSES